MSFKENLRDEISFQGLQIKEVANKIGLSNSTFLSYVDSRGSLPNAEVAVKIAQALGVSVEYLVTGKDEKRLIVTDNPIIKKYKTVIDDLEVLPQEISSPLVNAIHFAAENERKKQKNISAG